MPSARSSMLDRTETAEGSVTEAADATRLGRFRGGGFNPSTSRHAGWIALAAVLALWQGAGSPAPGHPPFPPAPPSICRAIYQLALSGALWQHLAYSIMRIGVGWVLGTIAGVAVGFAIGLSR